MFSTVLFKIAFLFIYNRFYDYAKFAEPSCDRTHAYSIDFSSKIDSPRVSLPFSTQTSYFKTKINSKLTEISQVRVYLNFKIDILEIKVPYENIRFHVPDSLQRFILSLVFCTTTVVTQPPKFRLSLSLPFVDRAFINSIDKFFVAHDLYVLCIDTRNRR